jgi:hypothetical protein
MGAVAILRRLVGMIRHYLAGVQIRVRLDGGFAHPAVLEFLDAEPRLEWSVDRLSQGDADYPMGRSFSHKFRARP